MKDIDLLKELKILTNPLKVLATDEVGRGCLAGNVVICSVFFHGTESVFAETLTNLSELGVTDSKKLSLKKRNIILDQLNINLTSSIPNEIYQINKNLSYIITEKEPTYIDKHNILQSTLDAMLVSFLPFYEKYKETIWLIDGNQKPKNIDNPNIYPIIKGDSHSFLISLASIIAKNFRDEEMKIAHIKNPEYGFNQHMGYGTKKHIAAIKENGFLPIHRKSFKVKL